MVKKEIRKIYIGKRNGLSQKEVEELSSAILTNFSALNLQGIQYLLSYYPIPERKEFNVSLCEQLLALENPDLQIAWPRLYDDGFDMEAVHVTKQSVLVNNRFNILEPAGMEILAPQMIDAVFVPLVAFDSRGYRVGYGKGYYDRYLARCAQDVVKIGFSYFEEVEAINDIDQFDVPLNYCITPMRVYEF
jgi:5-formyltetrahydrofolate cyclo-ligase